MPSLTLYGTLTSPYVRRVRIVALELGVDVEWIDATTDDGQRSLRAFNPLWKVPAARLGGEELLDSHLIDERLMAHFGPGPLAAVDPSDVATAKLCTVIDGVLDCLINAFYLRKDGADPASVAYVRKQFDRGTHALGWLEERVNGPWLTEAERFGLPEIALVTTLEWIRFRNVVPLDAYPNLVSCAAHHAARPSVAQTAPPV